MDPLVEGKCGPHMLFIEPWALHAMNLISSVCISSVICTLINKN
jgi:hypothetical protein